ncbi:MAG: 2-oxoglutarate dehydrogenase complex dihydrolipoyllysine-residue succinyltransferase [Breznakibacter sp.]
MILEIKAPTPGESITEVEITNWLVQDGDFVDKNQDLAEIESDKATLTLTAPEAGKIKIVQTAGETTAVGKVVCLIDTSQIHGETAAGVSMAPTPVETMPKAVPASKPEAPGEGLEKVKVTPVAQNLMASKGWSVDDVVNGLRRLTANDVREIMQAETKRDEPRGESLRTESRQKMSQLRKKISQRLVAVKNETAMLTTFNEVDMSAVLALREKHQKAFVDRHQVKLGLMSFFIKASALALKMHPMVNSMIDGDEIVTPGFVDVSVAVQTPKGLMVPVIRSVELLSLAQIEQGLKQLADKAREGKIALEEMTGGTFTITNGGVFGSMLSTPIINPPQSAILGMHNVVERPVAISGRVEIRPIMYVALSYDHRIIDGKESVGFLTDLKKIIENPSRLLVGGQDIDKTILGLNDY